MTLVICNLAARLSGGIDRLYNSVLSMLQDSHNPLQGAMTSYRRRLCFSLISLIPEECETLDISRSSRLSINQTMEQFLKEYLARITALIASNVVDQELLAQIFSSLSKYSTKGLTLTTLYTDYRAIFDCGWSMMMVNSIQSYTVTYLTLLTSLLSSSDSPRSAARDEAVFTVCCRLIEIFNLFKGLLNQSKNISSDEILFTANAISMVEGEIQFTASHNDLGVGMLQIALFLLSYKSKRVSLNTVDIWLTLSDIRLSSRIPYLQKDVYRTVLSIIYNQSIHRVDDDDDITVEEYRDVDVGIYEVTRCCFEALEADEYIDVLVKEYSSKSNEINTNAMSPTVIAIHEVTIHYIQLAIDFEEDLDMMLQCQSFKEIFCHLYRIVLSYISQSDLWKPSGNNDDIYSHFLQSALQFISKGCRLSRFVVGESILREYFVTTFEIMSHYLLLPQGNRTAIVIKAYSSIISQWANNYMKHISTEEQLRLAHNICDHVMACLAQNHHDNRQVTSDISYKESKGDKVIDDKRLFVIFLRFLSTLDHPSIRCEVLSKAMDSVKTLTETLLHMISLPTMKTIDCIRSYVLVTFMTSRILEVFGDLSTLDVNLHTLLSQFISLSIIIYMQSEQYIHLTHHSIFLSSDAVFQGVSMVYSEMMLWEKYRENIIIDHQLFLDMICKKLKSKSSIDIQGAIRCITASLNCYQEDMNDKNNDKQMLCIEIFYSSVKIVSEAIYKDEKNVIHVFDDGADTIEVFYNYLYVTLSKIIIHMREMSSYWTTSGDIRLRQWMTSIIYHIIKISVNVYQGYSHEEALPRSIFRVMDIVYDILMDQQIAHIFVTQNEMLDAMNRFSMMLLYYGLLLSSSSLHRSLAMDILIKLIAFYSYIQRLDELKGLFVMILASGLPNELIGQSTDVSLNDVFHDPNIHIPVVMYLINMCSQLIVGSTDQTNSPSKELLAGNKRRFRSYCEDVNKVWKHELDVESLQDYFM